MSVPKPGAVKALQLFGVLWIILGGVFIFLGTVLRFHELAKLYLYLIAYLIPGGLFALLAGWRRPPGLVAGIIALVLMLPAWPFGGPIFVAVVGFLAAKGREDVRAYYSQGIRYRTQSGES